MITPPVSLQDLRKSLYIKAKTEPTWRFWGLYVHVCKEETLQEAYALAKKNDGGARNRRCYLRGHRSRRRGELSSADTGRINHQHVSTHAGAEEGDTEEGEHESANSFDTVDP
jgi:hypothetical protein